MTVLNLFNLWDRNKTQHWDLYIWDMSGNKKYGYVNSVYTLERIAEAFLNCKVEKFKIGYSSLHVFINPPIEAAYRSEEICIMDGYEKVHDNLYAKNDSFAIIER